MRAIIFLILIPSCYGIPEISKLRTVKVIGTLKCRSQPVGDVNVMLYDTRDTTFIRSLTGGKTDWRGGFALKTETLKNSQIEPGFNLVFSHWCTNNEPCQRKTVALAIPSAYIGHGRYMEQHYDFGILNLEGKTLGRIIGCKTRRNGTVSHSPDRPVAFTKCEPDERFAWIGRRFLSARMNTLPIRKKYVASPIVRLATNPLASIGASFADG
ncbi:Transthyretin-like family protein [Ancylostoma ceylanicum]|uniref:Transthyretin-like family protein n=1 Tax=Ancylostoma ceylanicum TaxID=53326 RepID=A0A0D6LQI7_9BILA|nr:Transthyretin-like family protein [Ancylostoma ceylanicum]